VPQQFGGDVVGKQLAAFEGNAVFGEIMGQDLMQG